jgi:hypothetical protein
VSLGEEQLALSGLRGGNGGSDVKEGKKAKVAFGRI